MSTNNSEDTEDEIRKRTTDQDLPDKPEETQDTEDEILEQLLRATK